MFKDIKFTYFKMKEEISSKMGYTRTQNHLLNKVIFSRVKANKDNLKTFEGVYHLCTCIGNLKEVLWSQEK